MVSDLGVKADLISSLMEKLDISTARLRIRNLRLTDLNSFHSYRSNPDVTKYQGFDVMTLGQAEEFLKDQIDKEFGNAGEWVQYGIENKKTQKIIGDCAIKLDLYDDRIAEVGITISHLEQRKGFAKEAFFGILGFLFTVKDLHRIAEITDAENIAAINLMESIGFRQEGHFIENVFFKGKWGSEIQFAMLKAEWNDLAGNRQF